MQLNHCEKNKINKNTNKIIQLQYNNNNKKIQYNENNTTAFLSLIFKPVSPENANTLWDLQ